MAKLALKRLPLVWPPSLYCSLAGRAHRIRIGIETICETDVK